MRNQYLYPVVITHRCGHRVTRQEGGSRFDRDCLAGRLSLQECPDCRNTRGGGEVVQIDGADHVLYPISTGTDAQIKWAVSIRRKVLNVLLKNRQPGENPVEWMLFKSDAKWWIDHRNVPASELFQQSRKAA